MSKRRVRRQITARHTVRVQATKIEASHLKPGDLFSDRGPEYWNTIDKFPSTPLFVRTNNPDTDEMDELSGNASVFLLTIHILDNEARSDLANKHVKRDGFSPYMPPGMTEKDWMKKL